MSEKIEWCIVRLKDDFKWWLEKMSNDMSIDADYSGIIDPRQFEHIIELATPLMEYGLRNEIIENAFLKFRILSELPGNQVKLEFTTAKAMSSEEPLFLLPNIIANSEDEGPYTEFIDHIIRLRIKLLNDLIDFKTPINSEEIEEVMREKYQEKYIEGNKIHIFDEIVDILEYTPTGYDITKRGEFEDEDDHENEEYMIEGENFEAEEADWDDEELQKLEIVEQ
ncbi:MAG: hypothetical protein LBS71_00175 [Puniceicoccales bacterium]|jgi:hypothetical protein|nr:hypothetical protein [Puniceicoccales bacterium]